MDSDHEVNHNGFYSAAEEDFELEAAKNGEHFIIDDLLNFSNGETMAKIDDGLESAMTDSSMVTTVDTSCNSFSPSSFGEPSSAVTGGDFSGGLCVPNSKSNTAPDWVSVQLLIPTASGDGFG